MLTAIARARIMEILQEARGVPDYSGVREILTLIHLSGNQDTESANYANYVNATREAFALIQEKGSRLQRAAMSKEIAMQYANQGTEKYEILLLDNAFETAHQTVQVGVCEGKYRTLFWMISEKHFQIYVPKYSHLEPLSKIAKEDRLTVTDGDFYIPYLQIKKRPRIVQTLVSDHTWTVYALSYPLAALMMSYFGSLYDERTKVQWGIHGEHIWQKMKSIGTVKANDVRDMYNEWRFTLESAKGRAY